MYKHVLIPTDGSALADKAVEAGIEFAREAPARITFFVAVPEYQVPPDSEVISGAALSLGEHDRRSRERAEAILAPAAAKARAAGVAVGTDYAQSDRPHEAIVEAARRHGCDAIFMASHARKGLAAFWHGSRTVDVLSHSDIPTLVYR